MTQHLKSFCFLPLFKPIGPTSHDMVDIVRKLVPKKIKVGHTGTLDPFASGVLIMAVGKATRFADDIHRLPKSYTATLRLGTRTNTLDPTGEVEEEKDVPRLTDKLLREMEERFTGTISQAPPVFSAKKVDGRKSYELAREQQEVVLKPRDVTIHKISLEPTDTKTIKLDITCSTGTYVRALGRDLGEAMGSCGYLLDLERTAVGGVRSKDCVVPSTLDEETMQRYAMPISRLLKDYPEIPLPPDALPLLMQGRPFPIEERAPATFLGTFFDMNGFVRAIFRCAYDSDASAIVSKMLCYHSDN